MAAQQDTVALEKLKIMSVGEKITTINTFLTDTSGKLK